MIEKNPKQNKQKTNNAETIENEMTNYVLLILMPLLRLLIFLQSL